MLVALFLYVAVQILIGALVARRVRTEDDYLVAGRSLGIPLAAVSIFATWFGAESCLGAAGSVYRDGLSRTTVEPFAYGLCLLLMGAFYAAALWRAKITTLADLFRLRYGGSVEVVAAVLLIPTSLLWAAAQVRAFGHVLGVASGGSFGDGVGIWLAAGVVIVYTGLGGLLADVVTDVLQGALLVVGLVVLLVAVLAAPDGAAAWQQLPGRIRLSGDGGAGWLETAEAWALPVLGSLVAQEAVSRSLAARSPGVARRAALLGGGVYLLVGLVPVTLGLLGPSLLPDLDDGERLLPALADQLLHPALFLVFMGALVSAILSTVDSTLLVVGSVLSRNLILAGNRTAGDGTRLLLARGGVVLGGLGAALLAFTVESVAELVEHASGFGSAGIFVIVTVGLFTRKGGAVAANCSLLSGVLAWIVSAYLVEWPDGSVRCPYLLSVAAAVLGFAAGTMWQRLARAMRRIPEGPLGERPLP